MNAATTHQKTKKGNKAMTTRQIYEVLRQHNSEWIRSFMELAKQFEEATPEHRNMIIKFLNERKR